MTTGKNIALTRWTFVSKAMSLLFNMLSRFVVAFLPRSKCLLISWLQSPSAVILEPKKIKLVTIPDHKPGNSPWLQASSNPLQTRCLSLETFFRGADFEKSFPPTFLHHGQSLTPRTRRILCCESEDEVVRETQKKGKIF